MSSIRLPGLFGAALVGVCLTFGVSTPASSARLKGPRGALPQPADFAALVSDRRPITRGTVSPLTWAWANPLPSGDSFQAVAAGNGVYVAAGTGGILYSSTDGTHWTVRQSGVSGNLNYFDVYYANGLFVAGGTDASTVTHLTTSPDGVTWTDHALTLGTSTFADHIGYGNGTWVAVNQVALTSTDGVTWQQHSMEPLTNQPSFDSPVFANGVFASLGTDSTAQPIYYSADGGVTWQPAATSLPTTDFMFSMASNGHGFVLTGIDVTVSSGPAGVVYTSTDGKTWTRQALAGDGNGFYEPTLWNGSNFVTVSSASIGTAANVYTSPDGVIWTTGASATIPGFSGFHHPIVWTGSGYLGTGAGALQTQSSADFATWTAGLNGANGPTDDLAVVSYLNGHYLAAGPRLYVGTDEVIFESSDGLKWNQVLTTSTSGELQALAYGNGVYVAAGTAGDSYTSTDAKTWTAATLPSSVQVSGLAFGNGTFVAVGDSGSITRSGYVATSTDGKTWTQQTLAAPTNNWFTGVAYTGSRFVAVTNALSTTGPQIYTSTDGVNWTLGSFAPPTGSSWAGLHLSNGRLVAFGSTPNGTNSAAYVAVSTDGLSWTGAMGNAGNFIFYSDAFYDGTRYFATAGPSDPGTVYTSTDAQNWSLVSVSANAHITSFAFQGGRYVTAGDGGNLLVAEANVPVATAGAVSTTAGKAISGTLAATAATGATLSFSVVSQPAHGTVTLVDATAGSFKYTPVAGYTGKDSFTFAVNDGIATSAAATESVTVTAAPSSSSSGGGATPLLLSVLLLGFAVSRRRA